MPLVYQQNINAGTKLGVWHIAEPENFFLERVPLQQSITHPHKRLQHLAGRWLLKELYPDFPLELIRIADTRKPFLENEPFHFSISHCGDYAAVIVSRTNRVGVDIEQVKEKITNILHKFLVPEEQFLLPRGSITSTATLCWSIKEAVFKWYGAGQVDFREHIRIHAIDEEKGTVKVSFLKDGDTSLLARYIFFNGNSLSWILS